MYKIYFLNLVGISSNPCSCCKKVEKRKHDCSHEFCEANCSKKRTETNAALAEILPPNLSFLLNQNHIKKKFFQGGKPVIFGLKTKEDENITTNLNLVGNSNQENSEKNENQFNFPKNILFNSNLNYISNTQLPSTNNLFKSTPVDPIKINNTQNVTSSISTSTTNITSTGNFQNNPSNSNTDKKCFFMVKK